MADQNQRISDLLDALTDASSEEIETALRIFEPADVAAVVAERALAGGGGGGGSIAYLLSGVGSPAGVVDPLAGGTLYFDTERGALYSNAGTDAGCTNLNWVVLGGSWDYVSEAVETVGVNSVGDGQHGVVRVLGGASEFGGVFISDVLSISGPGLDNGIWWNATGVDGEQSVLIQLGSTGQHSHTFAADGSYHNPNGIIFPTSDPHIAGAWWDNAGTLTKSSG